MFLVNLPLGAIAVLLAFRLPNRATAGGKFRFDWLGIVLLAGFVIPLLLALERAQRLSLAAVPAIGSARRRRRGLASRCCCARSGAAPRR